METQEVVTQDLQVQKENEPVDLSLTDLHTEEGLLKLSSTLEKSNGKALLLVHPFYPEHPYKRSSPSSTYTKSYIPSLEKTVKATLQSRREGNSPLPIIIMTATINPNAETNCFLVFPVNVKVNIKNDTKS